MKIVLKSALETIIIFLGLLGIIFLIVFISSYLQCEQQHRKNLIVKQLPISFTPNYPENLKRSDEWGFYNHKGVNKIPYLYIDGSQVDDDDSANNNNNTNKLQQQQQKQKQQQPIYIVICHGAMTVLESAYVEYKMIAQRSNVRVVCLEYPGFGGRRCELNEDSLLKQYPKELADFLNEHLKVPWSSTILAGTCLGAVVASASVIEFQNRGYPFKHFLLNKPLISAKEFANDTFYIPKCCMGEMLTLQAYIPLLKIPPVIVQGDDDDMCRYEKIEKLIPSFPKGTRLIIIPKANHHLLITHAVETFLNLFSKNQLLEKV